METLVKFIEDVQNGNIKYSNRDTEIIEMFSVVTHTNDIKITMDGIEIKVDNEFYLLDNQGLEEFRGVLYGEFNPKVLIEENGILKFNLSPNKELLTYHINDIYIDNSIHIGNNNKIDKSNIGNNN